ncbi:MAG: HAMP domain-containing sensor histidine kinase [Thermomicrobiales bacterium]
MSRNPESTVMEVLGRTERGRSLQNQVRTSIRKKLTISYVVVVMMSGFIYAVAGFFVLMFLLFASGISQYQIVQNLPSLIALTLFVLLNIFLVTVCGIIAASVASWRFSRRLTRQVDELAEATSEFAKGNLHRRVAIMSDDELGQLAIRFNDLAERLQELDVQRREFVANVSHDLRTPVAIISGHLEAQLGERDESDRTILPREAFQVIAHETETLTSLIDDLFTLSRLEDAVLPIEAAPVNLAELIDDVVRGIRPYALQQSRVSVNALVEANLPHVLGDETRINQIINNLVHNAVRHTPAGGVVVVSGEPDSAANRVRVTVRDTGVGIASDCLPHIFERFYRGESTRDAGGTGLGLSIVKQLVEAQGGMVFAESTIGEGTAISFVLPTTLMPVQAIAPATPVTTKMTWDS